MGLCSQSGQYIQLAHNLTGKQRYTLKLYLSQQTKEPLTTQFPNQSKLQKQSGLW
jgi:hypothetical protein